MRLLLTAFVYVVAIWSLPAHCRAQLSLNQGYGYEQDGINTSGSHAVVAAAKRLRFFISFKEIGSDPADAISKLKAGKNATVAALDKAGAVKDSVKFTATKIREWESEDDNWSSRNTGLEPVGDGEVLTATTRASFDVTLEGLDPDEFPAKIYQVLKLLPKSDHPFDLPNIQVMYVGEVTDAQIAGARKEAYDDALAEAKALASLTGHPLGKLAAIQSSIVNEGATASFFGPLNDVSSDFVAKSNELLSNDPHSLSIECTIDLRFEIGKP